MQSNLSFVKRLLISKYTLISTILMVSFGVYSNTLFNNFVYDDIDQVLRNPWIRDVRYIPKIFLSDAWSFQEKWDTNYYRPMMHIIYMFDYHVFGLKPWGFRLTNILFNTGASVLVFLIVYMLLNKSKVQHLSDLTSSNNETLSAAFIAALLFATHPIHTGSVAGMGINELPFTFFYLLSFHHYIKADGVWGKWFVLSIVSFSLATLCKETAITLPILLFAYDYSLNRGSVKDSRFTPHSLIKRYLPFLIVTGLYLTLRTYAIGGFAPSSRHTDLSSYQYLINIFPLFIKYLEKLIMPINLNVFHVFHPISSISEWKGLITLVLTVAFISLLYLSRNKNRVVFFSLLWIVIPLLPVLYIPAMGVNVFTERYLYLPSVGFIILLSLAIERIHKIKILGRSSGLVMILIVIIITGLYSIKTIKRNYIWRDDYTLWLDSVKKSPDALTPHYNLATASYYKGLLDEAIEHYKTALRLSPNSMEAHNNLGLSYFDKGLLDEAIEHYKMALRIIPNNPNTHNNLGVAYFDKGLIDKAIEHYQMALRIKPNHPEARRNLDNAYHSKSRTDKAKE